MIFKKKILKIPTHLAIILDGNGRWAKSKGMIRQIGHQEGAKRVKEILIECLNLNIKVLTVFAFSTENWKRSKEEIDGIFSLPIKFLKENSQELLKHSIKLHVSGDISKLPLDLLLSLNDALEKTKNCNKMIFNVAINYGSKDELTRATKIIAGDVKNNLLNINDITPETINSRLYTSDLPDIDFCIRTSNEQRLSNFMLWQLSYSELYFPKTMWPAFTVKKLHKAIDVYSRRKRRFGGIKE